MSTQVTKAPTQSLNNLVRGCGLRQRGGIYAVYEENQIPISQFLHCPPMMLNPEDVGLGAQGVMVKEGSAYGRSGVWDIFDWVGTTHYPFIPDFVEEGRRYGFSRRIPENAPLHLLTEESLHILGHSKAILLNYQEFYENREGMMMCPKGHEIHDENTAEETCLGLLWEAITPEYEEEFDPGYYYRSFPRQPKVERNQFEYECRTARTEPEWHFGLFMAMPIMALEVIDDPIAGTDQQAMELLEESGTDIPYYLVEA